MSDSDDSATVASVDPSTLGGFKLIDSSVFRQVGGVDFESLREQDKVELGDKFTYCDICDVPMNQTTSGLECPECHVLKQIIGSISDCGTDNGSGVIKTSFGAGHKSIYTSVPDNSKSQKKQILEQLHALNQKYEAGSKIPLNVIEAAAQGYNDIQKLVIDKYDDQGVVCGTKKFVKRGSIKDETLGAWLYFSCITHGLSRKKKDIAAFMQLSSHGISRGEIILRDLHNQGKITIPVHAEPSDDFPRRYLEALDLYKYNDEGVLSSDSIRYLQFVNDLVHASIKKRVAVNSIKSSKIVGAIWVLISHCKINITSTAVEDACDKTRTNTFTRFSRAVDENILLFKDVFDAHGIPTGIRGRVVLKKRPVVPRPNARAVH